MGFLTNFKRALKTICGIGKPILAIAFIPTVFILIYLFVDEPELSFRVSGLILELLGLSIVVWQLAHLRKILSLRGPLEILLQHGKSLLALIRGSTNYVDLASEGVTFSVTALDGTLTQQIFTPSAKDSLEMQIETHLKNIRILHEDISELRHESRKELEAVRIALQENIRNLEEHLAGMDRKISQILTGDHGIQLLGVFWIAAGLIMNNISDLLTKWIFG